MSSEEIKTIKAGLNRESYKNHKRRLEPAVTTNLSDIPFYKQLLVDYLGRSHTTEMYDDLFDEVARDVDYRFKKLNLQSIIN